MQSDANTRDSLAAAMRSRRDPIERAGIYGHATYELRNAAGELIQVGHLVKPDGSLGNLITDVGDEYNARKNAHDVGTVADTTGMRLGTGGATAAAKNGAGAAIVTYVSGSNKAFDSAPSVSDLGAGSGHRATRVTTWAAGEATANGIDEAVITNESPLTDVAGAAANTIARGILSPVVNKAAGDELTITWHMDFNGT